MANNIIQMTAACVGILQSLRMFKVSASSFDRSLQSLW